MYSFVHQSELLISKKNVKIQIKDVVFQITSLQKKKRNFKTNSRIERLVDDDLEICFFEVKVRVGSIFIIVIFFPMMDPAVAKLQRYRP